MEAPLSPATAISSSTGPEGSTNTAMTLEAKQIAKKSLPDDKETSANNTNQTPLSEHNANVDVDMEQEVRKPSPTETGINKRKRILVDDEPEEEEEPTPTTEEERPEEEQPTMKADSCSVKEDRQAATTASPSATRVETETQDAGHAPPKIDVSVVVVEEETDHRAEGQQREVLRIDAGSPSSVTTPTSGVSIPMSPDGQETPNGSEAFSNSAKRRRMDDAPPLFLEKTYDMLEHCAPEIACWSRDGDSFIVKKPVDFAETTIPHYFKHKNFSSFVRQLNFYGFRKVRVDPESTGGIDPREWWEFKHDKFRRGNKEALKEMKRRNLSHNNDANKPVIDRAEIDELRAEVSGLREQIQQLNKHMLNVMQSITARANQPPPLQPPSVLPSSAAASSSPSLVQAGGASTPTLPSMSLQTSQYYAFPHTPSGGSGGNKKTPSPASAYQLRPIQSIIDGLPGNTNLSTPTSLPSPSFLPRPSHLGGATPPTSRINNGDGTPGHPPVDWDTYNRQHYEQFQRFVNPYTAPQTPTDPHHPSRLLAARANAAAAASLQKLRVEVPPPLHGHTPLGTPTVNGSLNSPDVAVHQLNVMTTHIRNDLMGCIIARIIGFLRIQHQHAPQEVDTVADAVVSDIQQKLDLVQEIGAQSPIMPGHGSVLDAETACMYRVEILKFISRELPRAVQEAVDKRLPPHMKKSLNRSLLALLVQKAQSALEHQMRLETTKTSILSHTPKGIISSKPTTTPTSG